MSFPVVPGSRAPVLGDVATILVGAAIGIWMDCLELGVRYGCLSQRGHVNAINEASKINESFVYGLRRWWNELGASPAAASASGTPVSLITAMPR